jgi:hypothetical protein
MWNQLIAQFQFCLMIWESLWAAHFVAYGTEWGDYGKGEDLEGISRIILRYCIIIY